MLARIYQYLIFAICFIAAYGLFAIKEKAGILSYQFKEVSRQVVKEQDAIHILKAEFAYLTSPDRLKKLSAAYLQLDSIKSLQMIQNPLAPNNPPPQLVVENVNLISIKRTKWRYKRPQIKYLQTVANRR